jgi:ABC-type branched-subunit amino acid transport system substrate-binding protein
MHPLYKSCLGLLVFRVFAAATSIRPVRAATGDSARSGDIEIAAAVCLTGSESAFGRDALEGLQLALDDANTRGDGPRLTLATYDEQSDVAAAKRVARRIAASPAVFVLGSVFSIYSLVEGPIFARAGLASLATATGCPQGRGRPPADGGGPLDARCTGRADRGEPATRRLPLRDSRGERIQ